MFNFNVKEKIKGAIFRLADSESIDDTAWTRETK